MKQRICRLCKRPHTRSGGFCPDCVKVRAAHKNEVMRQESRLIMRGWLPRSGMAAGPATASSSLEGSR